MTARLGPALGADPSGAAHAEIVLRAAAIAHGARRDGGALALPAEVIGAIDRAERRAHSLAAAGGGGDEARRAAALELVASVATVLRSVGIGDRGAIRVLVADAATAIGVSRGAANLIVFQRMLAAPELAQLGPADAIDQVLDLIVELGPADGVSLWRGAAPDRLERLGHAGDATDTRRLRGAARVLLATGRAPARSASHVRGAVVQRWNRAHAALVGRSRPALTARLTVYLAEAATALSPIFERELLYEQNASREHQLVSAAERRVARLGCDLHDGPLQDIVALAEDLRHARAQIASLLPEPERGRVGGRFDDLHARLASLDRDLRDVAQTVRSATAAECPLEESLRDEVDALGRDGSIVATLTVDGDLSPLTNSQRIVLLRVTQEALANVRTHSGARRVSVRLRATAGRAALVVTDDGCGFDLEAARRKGRLGLSGIVERVRLLGGDVDVDSEPGRGTRIAVTLPRWSAAAGDPDIPSSESVVRG